VTGYFSEGTTGLAYYPTTVPERILDTRTSIDPTDGAVLPTGGLPFTGELTQGTGQGVYVLNATVVPSAPLWVLTLYPDGITKPVVSTLNSYDATVTSNMAIVSAGTDGEFDAYAEGGPTQLILDLAGAFMPRPNSGPLVVFVGDGISAGLVAAAGQPNWQCINCLVSSPLLAANIPAVIAMKLALVHILTGEYELSGGGCGVTPCDRGAIPIGNIAAMVTQLKQANIPMVVGSMPSCAWINSYYFNTGLYYETTSPNESGSVLYGVPTIAYSGIPAPPRTATCPDAAYYSSMVSLAKAGIASALAANAK
jgi:hypothetical protein